MAGFLMQILTVGFGVAGILLLVRGIRGGLVLSEPHCATCGFDLRRTDGIYERCPECGVGLAGGRHVRFGRRRRQPLIAVGGLLVLIGGPLGMFMAVRAYAAYAMRQQAQQALLTGAGLSPFNLQQMTNDEVVTAMSTGVNQPWVWQEIERRRRVRTISAEQIRAAMVAATEAVEALPPVSRRISWGEDERAAWRAASIIDDDIDERWHFALAEPLITMAEELPEGKPLEFRVRCGMGANDLISAVRGVARTDGAPVTIAYPRGFRTPGVSAGGFEIRGTLETALPPGEYTFEFEIEVARLDHLAAQTYQSIGVPAYEKWPAEAVRRTYRVPKAVRVTGLDMPAAALATADPAFRTIVRDVLRPVGVSAVRSREGASGGTRLLVVSNHDNRRELPIAIVAELFVRAGEHEWRLGELALQANSRSQSGGQTVVRIPEEELRIVDVIYRAAPHRAAHYSLDEGIEVWGEDVVFEGIEVSWFDQ